MNEMRRRFVVFAPKDDGSYSSIGEFNDLTNIISKKDRLLIVDNVDKIIYILLDNENINVRLKVILAWAAQQLHNELGYPVANVSKQKLLLINKGKFSFRIDKQKVMKELGIKLLYDKNNKKK
ncbi:MAG: hypothetical protein ACP6IS_04185 [Candidatus Asgardarchaeia archaeon]